MLICWCLLPADARLGVPTAVDVVAGRHMGRPLRCGGHPVGTRKGASENVFGFWGGREKSRPYGGWASWRDGTRAVPYGVAVIL